jgi:hypothetical protein
MKPDKTNLLHDLLDSDGQARREATLVAGSRILRNRRIRSASMRMFAVAVLLGITTVTIQRISKTPAHVTKTAPNSPPQVESLTDDELLALFPDTAVGLVTLDNGKKMLIFPRREDEKRFVAVYSSDSL